jgi:dipeptidyl-peptidase-4
MRAARSVLAILGVGLLASGGSARAGASPLTLKRIFDGPPLAVPLPDWEWRPEGRGLVRVAEREGRRYLVAMDPATGTEEDLADLSALDALWEGPPVEARGIGRAGPATLLWGPDGTLLVRVKGDLVRLDLSTGSARRVTRTSAPMADLQLSPDGKWVSFTRANDLWVAPVDTEGSERRLTSGGTEDLLHGTLDWVYPEELGLSTAAWWSPDSGRLAFLRLDQTGVTRFPLPSYRPVPGAAGWVRYPKAGGKNPVASVGVVGREGGPPTWLDLGGAEYVARVAWTRDGRRLLVTTLDRPQRRLRLLSCDPATGASTLLLEETDDSWVEVPPAPRPLDDRRFLWKSQRDGSRRWWLVTMVTSEGPVITQEALTPAGMDAEDLLHHDVESGETLYSGTPHGAAASAVYRSRRGETAPPTRAPFATDRSGSVHATLDPSRALALVTTSSATTPPVLEVRRTADGTLVRRLADARTPDLDAVRLAVPEYGLLATPEGRLSWRLWKPAEPEPGRRYPVLVRVYGGPSSRLVRDAWDRSTLLNALLIQEGFLVFELDGRGTRGNGARFERLVRGRLGILELEDQARGVEMLRGHPLADVSRVGIWGWSYGGTMAALALCRRSDLFRAGVAVAPVTDWRLYDTIYTERYMGLPSENAAGYDESSCVKAAPGLSGRLLLAHGASDDNVHLQNTHHLVEALVRAGRTGFETMVYPESGHGLGGYHLDLFGRLLDFFSRHLR